MPTRRILCVDDNADACELLTTMLGRSGLEAVSAPGVDEALRLMELVSTVKRLLLEVVS